MPKVLYIFIHTWDKVQYRRYESRKIKRTLVVKIISYAHTEGRHTSSRFFNNTHIDFKLNDRLPNDLIIGFLHSS